MKQYNNLAVKLTGVSKKYILHHEKPTLVETILSRKSKEEFWALRDIDLEIKKGERVGLIGPNGAGKTTLLRIISGITTATKGEVAVDGKLVSLIGLGAGFHPDLTGEENIKLNGMLIGMGKREIAKKMKRIIKFAGIGKFIDSPFYTYSSGMALRLGFSIAIHSDPDILVLDEDLNVGDQEFQEKANREANRLITMGKTLILASHRLDLIVSSCKRAILLDKGKMKSDGRAGDIISRYEKSVGFLNDHEK